MIEKLTPRDIESQSKRKKIAQAALELFKLYGYENTTIADISKACGMSSGSIYHFFGSKEGLLSTIGGDTITAFTDVEISREHWEEKLDTPVETITTLVLEAVHQWETIGADLVLRMRGFFVDAYCDDVSLTVSPSYKPYVSLIEFLEACQQRGTVDAGPSATYIASFLNSICHGLLLEWCHFQGRYSLHEKVADYLPRIMASFINGKSSKA